MADRRVYFVPVYFAYLFSTAVLFRFTVKDIVKYLLALAYFVILTYSKGATVGKMAMNLRVVKEDGGRPDLLTVFYREFIGKFLSRILLYIGYLMIGADREKAALHDRLSDTRVVYKWASGSTPMHNADPQMENGAEMPVQDCGAPVRSFGEEEIK